MLPMMYPGSKSLGFLGPLLALMVGVGGLPRAAGAQPDDAPEPEPGLIATYRSLADPAAQFVRIDAKPSFTWGLSSPHPRLPPGRFAVTWTGLLLLREAEPVRFGAFVGGELSVTLDDVTVLRGRGERETTWILGSDSFSRPPGLYRLQIRFRSLPNVPARLQLGWEGAHFAREPLPASRLRHHARDVPDAARHEELVSRGREAALRLGCGRCHPGAFPGLAAVPPGPSLAGLVRRVERPWLLAWLSDPSAIRSGARMPALFRADRQGLVERTLVSDYLLGAASAEGRAPGTTPGDHRAGKQAFLGLGCVACHQEPEKPAGSSGDPERFALAGLAERLPAADLSAFLQDPASRYPDLRMPPMRLSAEQARDVAAYLLRVAPPAPVLPSTAGVRPEEVEAVLRRLGAADRAAAGRALVREKGCARCHPGLEEAASADVPLRQRPAGDALHAGCLSGQTLPRFSALPEIRRALAAYVEMAGREKYPSPFAARQEQLRHLGCARCHQRDGDRPAPLEEIGHGLWTPFLYRLPYQRTPRLTQATAKLTPGYLLATVRAGVSGVRPDWYSYRMPSFGDHAPDIVRALAEGDGNLPAVPEPGPAAADPNQTALGPVLVGFEGYACVTCHVWNGQALGAVEPGSVGPELAGLPGRLRREWFDRFLDDPPRTYPGTPMPGVFRKGAPAPLTAVLGGDAARQKEALWSYFALGKQAPSPKPKTPLAISPFPEGTAPLVAQIPIHLPDHTLVEGLCVLFGNHDLLLYDVEHLAPRGFYTGAQLLRQANVWRSYTLAGTPAPVAFGQPLAAGQRGPGGEQPSSATFQGYERLPDGVRVRCRLQFRSGPVEVAEDWRVRSEGGRRLLVRGVQGSETCYALPPPKAPPKSAAPPAVRPPAEDGPIGPLQRPGYQALLYPRPKTAAGEDLVMPSALAADPRTGRLFVASLKQGDLFVLRDPQDNGQQARFESYARGLFQDVFGLAHDGQTLTVLHRRNLTRLGEHDGTADRADRVAALPHAVGDAYDWAYGLVRDRTGAFCFTFAPHANQSQRGAGSLLRLVPSATGGTLEEVAFGFRNPLGWCAGPGGELFFTDNQGDWVATNKLCHVEPGRFYGFPNPAHPEQARPPAGRAAVWVPYDWARSLNGLAYDNSGGQFGPFAGQFFLAELMDGGAIVRAAVEQVNGVYQGACFPFWGKGLLGPLALTFDPRGRLWVGAITQPGWMGQPDRGALFRIAYTGPVPFEIASIHVRPHGFRLVFTAPVAGASAGTPAAYAVEQYRYEYTGAYGSPELDRTPVAVRQVAVGADGRSVELTTDPLVKGRVYALRAPGVRSLSSEPLVHPVGVYTLHEIPAAREEPQK
jgi:glucose/arabinose dehydrogenase/mono/diheme cytochrome c family protein